MSKFKISLFALGIALAASGCSVVDYAIDLPQESVLAAMPGNGKSPQQFALEKQACESKGYQMASKFRHDRVLKDTLTVAGGMALAAALGAITGAPYGGVGTGAAIGAAAGGAAGTGRGAFDTSTPQGAFDQAYWKCMVEAGNIVKTPSGDGILLRVYTH